MLRHGGPGFFGPRAVVAAGAVVALALCAYGASAVSAARDRRGADDRVAGVADTTAVIVGLAAALVAAVLLVALLRGQGGRRPVDEHRIELPPYTRFSRLLAVLGVVVAFAIPAGGLIAVRHAPSLSGRTAHRTSASSSAPPSDGRARSGQSSAAPPTAGIVAAVAVIATAGAIVLWRRDESTAATPTRAESGEPDSERLARGITAAAAALGTAEDDDRAAIVASYAAMERALADAGAARRRSDTPIELLGRVSAAGLVTSAAAVDLTELFHEAGYSAHPMGPSQRNRARLALARLTDELGAVR